MHLCPMKPKKCSANKMIDTIANFKNSILWDFLSQNIKAITASFPFPYTTVSLGFKKELINFRNLFGMRDQYLFLKFNFTTEKAKGWMPRVKYGDVHLVLSFLRIVASCCLGGLQTGGALAAATLQIAWFWHQLCFLLSVMMELSIFHGLSLGPEVPSALGLSNIVSCWCEKGGSGLLWANSPGTAVHSKRPTWF